MNKELSMLPYISRINSEVLENGLQLYINRGLYFYIKEAHPREVKQIYNHYVRIYGDKAWDE